MSKKLKKLSEKTKPIIADTSPMLLLLMGLYDETAIAEFKRLSEYKSDDYDLLSQFVRRRKIIVTPQVLAEVSNFAKELKPNKFSEFIEKNRQTFEKVDEKYIPKTDILASQQLVKFGFTDTSIILAAKENNGVVLTDDFALWGLCKTVGLDAKHMKSEILSQKEISSIK